VSSEGHWRGEETHPYHCQKGAGGTKDGRGWCNAATSLARFQALDTALKVETVVSRRFSCLEFGAIVGGHVKYSSVIEEIKERAARLGAT